MMRAFGRQSRFVSPGRRSPAINIAPLIDVQFLLLIFLLISTTFRIRPALRVDLPRAESAAAMRTGSLTISVAKDDSYAIAGTWVTAGDLRRRLVELRARTGDRPVALHVDRRASSGALVFALDAARSAGYKQIILPTTRRQERNTDGGSGEP